MLSTLLVRRGVCFHRSVRKAPAPVSNIPRNHATRDNSQASVERVRGIVKRAGNYLPDKQQEIQRLMEELYAGILVMCLGEFSAGKSTLINALVGEKKCKTGVKPTTMDFEEIPGPNGIRYIDTMGINAAGFEKQKEKTLEAVKRADVVFLVLRANQPFSEAETELCKEIRKLEPKLAVVVTYWDTMREEQAQKDCKARIQECINEYLPYARNAPVFYIDAWAAAKRETGYNGEQDFNGLLLFIDKKLGDMIFQMRRKCSTVLSTLAALLSQEQEVLTRSWASKKKKISAHMKQASDEFEDRMQALGEKIGNHDSWIKDNVKQYQKELSELRARKDSLGQIVASARAARTNPSGGSGLGGFWAGGAIGAAVAGPPGAAIGGTIGAILGQHYSVRPHINQLNNLRDLKNMLQKAEQEVQDFESTERSKIKELQGELEAMRAERISLKPAHHEKMDQARKEWAREETQFKKSASRLQDMIDTVTQERDCLEEDEGEQ